MLKHEADMLLAAIEDYAVLVAKRSAGLALGYSDKQLDAADYEIRLKWAVIKDFIASDTVGSKTYGG